MRQRTNAQALVSSAHAKRLITLSSLFQVPIPCGSSSADIHMSIALNITVSHASCPICEHVIACPLDAADDSSHAADDACGVDIASESPPVPARMEARFSAHAPGALVASLCNGSD
jgi:hypothetical protein